MYTESLSPDFRTAVDMAERLEVPTVDLRSVYGHSISDISDSELSEIRRIARSHPVRLACVSSVVFAKGLTLFDESMYRDQMQTFLRTIHVCETLNVPMLRIFGFDKPNASVWSQRPDIDSHMALLADRLAEPVRIAERSGITLALETEGECYVGTSSEARQVVDHIGSENLRVCWDVLNAYRSGERAFEDGYDRIRDIVVHLHCKDAPLDPIHGCAERNARCLLGTGDVPYRSIFERLTRDQYNGVALAERHYSRLNQSAASSNELLIEISAEIAAIRRWAEGAQKRVESQLEAT